MELQMPLDIVSTNTCSAAYAAYRVSTVYIGPTITVRRSSDNVTSDFYADPYGQLGTTINGTGTSLESWLNNATGFVTKWYDQSGKGNHATQATSANQPRIDYINHRLDFTTNSGTAFLSIPNGTGPNSTQSYTVTIKHNTIGNTSGSWLSSGDPNASTSTNIFRRSGNTYTNEWYIQAPVTKARYIKFEYGNSTGTARYMNLTGVAVYTSYNGANIINPGMTATSNSIYPPTAQYGPSSMLDNNSNTIYHSGGNEFPYVLIDLGAEYSIHKVELQNRVDCCRGRIAGGRLLLLDVNSNIFYTSSLIATKNGSTTYSDLEDGNYYFTWWPAFSVGSFGSDQVPYFGFDPYIGTILNNNTNTYSEGNIVTQAYDGTSIYLYTNGGLQGSGGRYFVGYEEIGNEYIGYSPSIPSPNQYFNGEMHSLFIFKSFLSDNERTHIEKNMPFPNITVPVRFSQLRTACSLPTAISFSQLQKFAGIAPSSATSISAYNGFVLRNGLFMRFYSNTYFANNVNFFNSNTPTITGVVTNLRNTYCATGGISNADPVDHQIGNIAVMTTFSAEWFGLFYAPITGTYTFYLLSTDTGIIWIGNNALSGFTTGNALINTQGVFTEVNATIALTAGTYYPFRFQYGAGGGKGSTLKFSFTPPSGSRVYDGTGYFFCQTINNTNNKSLSVYLKFEPTDDIKPSLTKARYVGFEFGNAGPNNRYINVVGVSVFSSYTGSNIINTAMTVTVSELGTPLINLIDNDDATIFYTNYAQYPWVIIDLGSEQYIYKVQLHNRVDCCGGRIAGLRLFLRNNDNTTIYTSNLVATRGGSTTYEEVPSQNGYLYYTWWPSINTIAYGSDSIPIYNTSGYTLYTLYNGTNEYSSYTLYNGASVNTSAYKLGTSSLSLTASLSQYAQISNFTPTTGGLTFAFWYKSNSSGNYARIFDFSNSSSTDNILLSPSAPLAAGTNRLLIQVFVGSVVTGQVLLTDINYNDNVWRHIAWTLTYAASGSSTSTWNVYVNGVNKLSGSTYQYPSISVTRTLSYIGKSAFADPYYNGNIDDFRIYNTVLSEADVSVLYNTSTNYTYRMLNGSNAITTTIQGTTPTNPATSGYAIYSANPWLSDGYYWIKSAAMPNALEMYVDIKNGGYDFYRITGGINVNFITQTHSGTALGLELTIPRSQDSWRAIYKYVHTVLSSDYGIWLKALPIYKTSSGGNYTAYAMFDPRFGNSGSIAGSYPGAPDWRCIDGGLWYIRDVPFSAIDGNYTANAFLLSGPDTYPQFLTPYGSTYFDDNSSNCFTGTSYIVSTNYAGCTTSTLYKYFDGSTSARAAPSALYIKNHTGTNVNGIYWINLPIVGPTQIYCIMDSAVDGGGWMMAMKATRGTTFFYDSSHWTQNTTLNPTDTTRNDGDAKFNTMNHFKCKDMLALWPDIQVAGGSLTLSTYNNWCWMKNNFNGGVKQTLINFFGTGIANFSFGAAKGPERGYIFSSQAGFSFYGINFTVLAAFRVRWGFAWNNEFDWNSNDVSGGIGMAIGGYSAGDFVSCCADQGGMQRTARVEMYIR